MKRRKSKPERGDGAGPDEHHADVRAPERESHDGLECWKCGCHHFNRVLWTRPRGDGTVVRRRECRNCGTVIRTVERVEP